ncbi:MAG: SusD/RagB family nutrient-binding outer membrane lipoprotein [Prevotellaceae bacterium]|nr:SusD/RagB family nutrient-binding outer membrane lipoprotein [Candidatus Minthosoma equi]
MKKIYKSLLTLSAAMLTLAACSDSYMERMNVDDSKFLNIDPNAQLTTGLLQTYGDFQLMDTYRSYITGFTQYYAGGWNVSNYAGAVYPSNNEMSHLWERYYGIGLKNLSDAIAHSDNQPNTNAALRIHKAYLLNILTDTYGDIPCKEVGLGYLEGKNNPKYDTQESIYNWLFEELEACAKQMGTGTDKITGDVTSMKGNSDAWKRYANSLRMRLAMRISSVAPEKAKAEFEKAMNAEGGYITTAAENAYIVYLNSPFTLYDGAVDYDFRANALSEILYGQDPTSPTFVSSTLFNHMEKTSDPRMWRICRNYIHTSRSQTSTDGNFDVTDEVAAWKERGGVGTVPCNIGDAWWSKWVNGPDNSEIPTLDSLVKKNPTVGYDQNNFPARMIRPSLCVNFQNADCPGILITSAEIEFLLAEAATLGWNVKGTADEHYEAGIRASMHMINDYYILPYKNKSVITPITEDEINDYIAANPLGSNPKEAINTQAWILHLTNPSEGWANLRRSDYPALMDRTKLPIRGDFPQEESNLMTPTRLKYPNLEQDYNLNNYTEAIKRLGGSDDWHKRVWWDTKDQNFYDPED